MGLVTVEFEKFFILAIGLSIALTALIFEINNTKNAMNTCF